MELKVKELCVFNCIEPLFFNGLFQNKFLQNIFHRKQS